MTNKHTRNIKTPPDESGQIIIAFLGLTVILVIGILLLIINVDNALAKRQEGITAADQISRYLAQNPSLTSYIIGDGANYLNPLNSSAFNGQPTGANYFNSIASNDIIGVPPSSVKVTVYTEALQTPTNTSSTLSSGSAGDTICARLSFAVPIVGVGSSTNFIALPTYTMTVTGCALELNGQANP